MMSSAISIVFFLFAFTKAALVRTKNETDLSSLEWKRAHDGNIPINALFNPQMGGKTYFCRAEDNQTGKTYIGSLRKGQRACEFIVVQEWVRPNQPGQKILKSNPSFEVLTSINDAMKKNLSTWKWKTHQLGSLIVPRGAIPCDSTGDGNGCYLGISVYSDAICSSQTIGKVNMALQYNTLTDQRYGLAYVVEFWNYVGSGWKAEGNTCPFFQFLIIN